MNVRDLDHQEEKTSAVMGSVRGIRQKTQLGKGSSN